MHWNSAQTQTGSVGRRSELTSEVQAQAPTTQEHRLGLTRRAFRRFFPAFSQALTDRVKATLAYLHHLWLLRLFVTLRVTVGRLRGSASGFYLTFMAFSAFYTGTQYYTNTSS